MSDGPDQRLRDRCRWPPRSKTTLTNTGAQVRQVNLLSDTAIELVVALDEPLAFLPGQYVNIQVPGTLHVRAYSFSSLPGSSKGVFDP